MGNESSNLAFVFQQCFEEGVDAKVADLQETFGVRTNEMEQRAIEVMNDWGQQNKLDLATVFDKFDYNHDREFLD